MEYVEAEGRAYQVCEKAGSKRVRLTIGTDYHTGRQLQREYTGRSAEEIQKKIDSSLSLSDTALQLLPEDKKLKALIEGFLAFKTLSVCSSTLKKLELTYRRHIDPYLGDRSMRVHHKNSSQKLYAKEKKRLHLLVSMIIMKKRAQPSDNENVGRRIKFSRKGLTDMPKSATLKQASKQARHNCALFEYELNSHQAEKYIFLRLMAVLRLFDKNHCGRRAA